MVVLALDTTTRRGSIALSLHGRMDVFAGDERVTHGERLPGDIITLLSRHKLSLADVDVFAVAAGPGSFTGLRIGIATMQGFALAGGRPMVAVSALDALARSIDGGHRTTVATWIDAQRGEVFSALYEDGVVVDGPTVELPVQVLTRWRDRGELVFTGDGARAYRELIQSCGIHGSMVEAPDLAPTIARLAEEAAAAGRTIAPDEVRPIYIRRPDAELARDRATPPMTSPAPARS